MAASTQHFWVGPDEDPNRYRLESHHSSGAEGEVWRGSLRTAAGTELDVAVKILHARRQDLIADWQARWTEQVELLRSLQYPGVIAVREAFEGDFMHPHGQQGSPGRSLYLIMNWVEGEPLHEWISRRPDRDVFESLRLLGQAAAALDYIHSGRATRDQPVVHRDVKPANIIVSDGQAVLVDFGLARVLTTTAPAGASGTSLYMAPEAFSSGQYSPASDRYSLGCVAYYVLTGEDPPKEHDLATMRARLAQVPAIGANPTMIRNALAMLDPDPSKRPVRASTWVQLFQNTTLSQAGGKGLPPPPPDPTQRQTPKNPRRAVVGVSAVVVLLAAVVGFFFVRDQGDSLGTGPTTTGVEPTPTSPPTVATTTTTIAAAPSTTFATTTTSKPGYRLLYQPVDLVLTDPGWDQTYIDLTVPKVFAKSSSTEGQVYYSTFFQLSSNKPHMDTVEPAIAARLNTNMPTPEMCDDSLNRAPLSGPFTPPPTGNYAVCVRVSDNQIGAFVTTSQDAKTNRLALKVMAWEI